MAARAFVSHSKTTVFVILPNPSGKKGRRFRQISTILYMMRRQLRSPGPQSGSAAVTGSFLPMRSTTSTRTMLVTVTASPMRMPGR